MRKTFALFATALAFACSSLVGTAARADAPTAICYNCPPEWADWATELASFKERTGISVPPDEKNSGQALSQMLAEKASPVDDVAYLGVTFGMQAKAAGVTVPYKPAGFDKIPPGLKDPDGWWFTIHTGTLGFFVNKKALNGKPVPQSWKDLLDPKYDGMVGFLDPSSAFVGYAGAVAVNQAMGGTLDNFGPGLAWFAALQKNHPIVPKQTAYARVLSGEIPIMLDYDFNAYRAEYKDKADVVFVIPKDGTIVVPYVMVLAKNAPHEANARKLLDFTLSDEGQRVWANAYMRPVIKSDASSAALARFLPASDYARAHTVDYAKMAAAEKGFSERYLTEIH